jgi:hypothetical protein
VPGQEGPTAVPPRMTAHWSGGSVLTLRDAIGATSPPVALVLGIARLGEAELRGWWQAHGLGQVGRYVLGDVFHWRTAKASGLELDVLSASRRQEQILARPTALHLLSDWLPFRRLALARLAECKTAGSGPLLDRLAAWDLDAATRDLAEWTAGAQQSAEVVGPGLLLGTLTPTELEDEVALRSVAKQLCAAYLEQGAELRPPYFDLVA